MSDAVLLMIGLFLLLLAADVPIGVAIAMATIVPLVGAAGAERAARIVAHRMSSGIEVFSLLAIPFFVLSGMLMGRGGLARRLVDFASALVGWLPGGLGHVTIATSMMFGAISGSAVAAVSSIGGVMIPEMRREGYDRDYAVALATSSGTLGLVIPPSNILIVYALASGGASIAALFMAGVIPGLLIGSCLMGAHAIRSHRSPQTPRPRVSGAQLFTAFRDALPSLLLVILVLGGIVFGIFTATEAAAVSVAYAFILTVPIYREIGARDLWKIAIDSAVTTAVVLFMVGASMAMSWMLARDGAPKAAAETLLALCHSKIAVLLIVNLILLAIGTCMDITPAVLILTPVLLPAAVGFGVDPVHFGILMTANLCVGLCTPPVGTCLYVGCGVGGTKVGAVLRPMLPLYAAMIVALLLITYVPALSLWLPKAMGLLK